MAKSLPTRSALVTFGSVPGGELRRVLVQRLEPGVGGCALHGDDHGMSGNGNVPIAPTARGANVRNLCAQPRSNRPTPPPRR